MAYIKSLLLTDVFPNGDFNTSTNTFEIPLSDLTGAGLDLTEATAEDARKFILAMVQKVRATQQSIIADYNASIALAVYTEGADYAIGDKVQSSGVEYEATSNVTNAPAILSSSDWVENNIKQPVENFTATQGAIRWASDGYTGTQSTGLNVVYSNTYDIANES